MRSTPVYGVTVHTTGSGLPKKSSALTPMATLQRAVRYYTDSGGPSYVIGWDGTIVATADTEKRRTHHQGIASAEKSKYASGQWQREVSPAGLRIWQRRWPGRRSPIELVPDRNLSHTNDYWIGIELIPVTDGSTTWFPPKAPGRRFSAAQHESLAKLLTDIGKRHGLPSGWKESARLVAHSDINPLTRDTRAMPMWDPGFTNLDWSFVKSGGLGGFAIRAAAAIGIGYALAKYVFK
ncbi:MAG: N-acetylmuramoyl-L-alanine amidase [Kiloniellales bacterium]|nr:N-acetylmuramoyl-L-alanine amidase [Kiloniellales bacterium]